MRKRLTSVLLASMLAGCSQEQAGTAADVASLNGELETSDCSAAETATLRAAVDHVMDEIGPFGSFESCIGNSVMTETLDATPEAIRRAIRSDFMTHIRCVNDSECVSGTFQGRACAGIGINGEHLKVTHSFLESGTPEVIGGTIAHEVMHNRGFDHDLRSLSGDFSVPESVEACIGGEFSPIGVASPFDRSAMTLEVELPHVGGGGGLPFELACRSCDYARGFRVETSTSNVNALSMHCDASTTQVVGMTNDSTSVKDIRCGNDEVVVGLVTGSDTMVNGFAALCAKESDVRAGDTDYTQWLIYGGTFVAPDVVLRACPSGMALKRVYGRAGGRIDQLRMVCERMEAPKQGVPHSIGMVGQRLGRSARTQCIGNGVMTGLYGRSGAEIDTVGGSCLASTSGPSGDVVLTQDWHLLPQVGGPGGFRFDINCPNRTQSDALVGLRFQAGARINQVQGICAVPHEWSNASLANVATTLTTTAGEVGGYPQELRCPRGEFLVGVETWTSQSKVHRTETVFGMEPICRRIDYPRPDRMILECIGDVDPGFVR